ncbi:Alpha-aminoadipic semialdehyde synthase, mitochondrial-like isoform X1 [Oopsacas minuta]|uniref:Alpha-aminoadipic semialdehyde synthase, mitochondrial-like isoform X1 n=1 Tax=Oopsacas minuta TaxID=111878 RepID=A0AAV7K1J6_9METZ|nr:Alpha-aminoadipic semialdehyde synthase, mitochondrial-like isoform X1 [Oopsacas minuta]
MSSFRFISRLNTEPLLELCKNTFTRSLSSQTTGTIGIVREESNLWERRAPLSPLQVGQLVKQGNKVLVQPSDKRIFIKSEYERAGATFTDDLSEADLILGVKQLLLERVIPDKTYVIFSHTCKGQPANMPLLDTCIQENVRLIDYEMIVDENKARLLAFGQFAGISGMINILYGMGIRLLGLGYQTPFLHLGLAHNYPQLAQAHGAVAQLGPYISSDGIPASLGPMIFCFTGSGNVSRGAQSIFRLLPHEMVHPDDLKEVAENGETNHVYGTVVDAHHHLKHKGGLNFDLEHYLKNGSEYTSNFSTNIAPYISCLVNGVFWAPGHPRVLTDTDASSIQAGYGRLLAVVDVSNDLEGSIEFSRMLTTLDKPFAIYDSSKKQYHEDFSGDGFLISNIDNLPTQLAIEATTFFGEELLSYIPDLMKVSRVKTLDDSSIRFPVRSAVVTFDKQLTPPFRYINDIRKDK